MSKKISAYDNDRLAFARTLAEHQPRAMLSINNCDACGIAGFCGIECPVFLAGECSVEDPEAFINEINELEPEERKYYLAESKLSEFYPNVKEFQDLK